MAKILVAQSTTNIYGCSKLFKLICNIRKVIWNNYSYLKCHILYGYNMFKSMLWVAVISCVLVWQHTAIKIGNVHCNSQQGDLCTTMDGYGLMILYLNVWIVEIMLLLVREHNFMIICHAMLKILIYFYTHFIGFGILRTVATSYSIIFDNYIKISVKS